MGSELQFYIHVKPGERVETDLTLPPEHGAVLTGVVHRADSQPVPDAVVLAMDSESGAVRCHCVTDSSGFYILGPLPPALYEIHVYDGSAPVRVVSISV